jgi:hypothetical protein
LKFSGVPKMARQKILACQLITPENSGVPTWHARIFCRAILARQNFLSCHFWHVRKLISGVAFLARQKFSNVAISTRQKISDVPKMPRQKL